MLNGTRVRVLGATNLERLLSLLQFTIQVHDVTFKKIVIKNANNNLRNTERLDRVILKMYTNSIQKIKSMYTLAHSRQHGGLVVIARSVIESMAYLDYILEDNCIERAQALETSFEVREEYNLKKALKFYKATNNIEMIDYTKELLKKLETVEFLKRKRDYLKYTIDRNHQNDQSGSRFYSYKNKVYNFYMLCKYLDEKAASSIKYEEFYTFFYVFFSRDVHGLNLEELVYVEQSIDINNLKTKDIEKYLEIIFSISLNLSRLICEKLFKIDYQQFIKSLLETTEITLDFNT